MLFSLFVVFFYIVCRRRILYPVLMEHLVLIDGHHLMYRAYWAIPRTLRTSRGEQVNAVFGVASMLLAMLKQEQPDRMLLCFDAGEETFRHKEHEAYKEGRAETPQEFYDQIPRTLELIDAFAFPHVADPRYEADDLLCAYARAATHEGMRVSIVSGDRDLLQLVSDTVHVVVPRKGYQDPERLGPREVEEKFGIRPEQIPAWKGLVGDASDNLSGVRGVGPRTGARLLQQYGTLEEIYAHLPEISPLLGRKLEDGREQAFFCQRMAQLVCDMPLSIPLDALLLRDMPVEAVCTVLQRFEFAVLLRRFREFLITPYGRRVFRTAEVPGEKGQLSLF